MGEKNSDAQMDDMKRGLGILMAGILSHMNSSAPDAALDWPTIAKHCREQVRLGDPPDETLSSKVAPAE
jgi:hypothetical protein